MPLMRFLICEECGEPFTGYSKKKKSLNGTEHTYYYCECRTNGCKINRSTPKVHADFEQMLESFQINLSYQGLIKEALKSTLEDVSSSDVENQRILKLKLSELNNKLETLEERFAYGEIDRSLFDKLSVKLKNKISEKTSELEKLDSNISNSDEIIDKVILNCFKTKEFMGQCRC